LNHAQLLQELLAQTKIVPPAAALDVANLSMRDKNEPGDTNDKLDQALLKLDAVMKENDVLRKAVIRENEWRRQQVNLVLAIFFTAAVHYLFPN
jgi:hypothetical protein